VTCEFCRELYKFNDGDLTQLLAELTHSGGIPC
jgi:hypothetical protein